MDDYHRMAEQAEDAAKSALTEDERRVFGEVAALWRALAERRAASGGLAGPALGKVRAVLTEG